MGEAVLSGNEHFYNNGEIEWQPLALTLVEYPKGILLYRSLIRVYLM